MSFFNICMDGEMGGLLEIGTRIELLLLAVLALSEAMLCSAVTLALGLSLALGPLSICICSPPPPCSSWFLLVILSVFFFLFFVYFSPIFASFYSQVF